MSDYSQSTFFAPKDLLATGNANKIIYGSDVDAELSAISTAIATKADVDGDAIGAGTPATEINVDNLKLDGNKITSTNTDGDIELEPDGTGIVTISSNVGIGTSNPASLLTIQAATPVFEIDSTTTSNTATIQFTSSGTVDSKITHVNNTGVMTIDSGRNSSWGGKIAFVTDTEERMRIDSSGNVGIGTDSPANLLHVKGASAGALEMARFRLEGATNNPMLKIEADEANQTAGLDVSGSTATELTFSVAGTEAARLDGSRRLGIGTSNPVAGIHVSGDSTMGETTGYFVGESARNNYVRIGADSNRRKSLVFESGGTDRFSMGVGDTDELSEASFFIGSGLTGGSGADLVIDAVGNVGIGTTNPGDKLAVHGASGNIVGVFETSTGNTNRLWLGATSTESYIDATAGVGATNMVFKVASTERMRIDDSGNLLVGTTSWTVGGGGTAILSSGRIDRSVNTTAAATQIYFANPNGIVGQISTSGTTTTYSTSSDARLKENIADAESASERIDAIQVRQFDWKADGSHQDYGMVAQELAEVAPEAVSGDPESDDMMGVDYSKLVPMLVKEIQSLRARVAALEA